MNKLKLLSLAVASIFVVASASAAQVKIIRGGDTSGYTKVVPLDSDFSWINNSYVAGLTSKVDAASKMNGFGAFCLEANEHFANKGVYTAVLNDRAIMGGIGWSGDPISVGTAWLVKTFAVGALDSYGFVYGNSTATLALQRAIWFLEGESGGQNNSWVALLVGKFGSVANAKADYTGNQVKVLNLWGNVSQEARSTNLEFIQDQVVYVPDMASTLGLFGVALLGVAALRRRNA
ncbi:VPDSG-CTERM sorting domain-containing protein [Nibricoccus sp. IMCC34717]|uniref:VPDSG-CTERM sorting domain-containing protein n=1 Tax=Nibricoccus sp. IMCC34717 TaxID=3034021 RepID=UPI00384F8D4C